MPVEVATYINQLDPLSPAGTDPKSQGDDHLRTIKSAVKQTFPNVAGAVNASHIELNHLVGVASAVQPQIDLKASKTGDSYTGIHDFSLATSVKLPAATTIGAVTASELGYLSGVTSAIQSQFSGVSTALTGKVSRSGDTYTGSHVMTGAVVTVVTQPLTDKSTKAASTKHVDDAITAAALSLSLPGQAGNAGKYLSTDGTDAGWASAPVVSVMGRSGVVTGLVDSVSDSLGTAAMSTAPLGQWTSFNSTGTAGSDWPSSQSTAWWNVFTFGQATRKTQIAIQVFTGAEQSSMFVRSLHDTTWSLWQRFLGDFSLLEKAKYVTAPGSAYTANPREATLQYLDISAPLTVNVSTSRQPGDQMTMMFSFPTVSSIAFSSNVKAPVGGIRAGVAGNILTVPLIARPDGYWQAYDGGLHPW